MKNDLMARVFSGLLVLVSFVIADGDLTGDTLTDGIGEVSDGVLYVANDGTAAYDTIQNAIYAASNGDVIIVMPGTYQENINLSSKAITLQSTDPGDPAIVTSTIIDGSSSGSVITCNSGETATTIICGFIITNNGYTGLGGGMFNESSSPTVSNCTFSGNTAYLGGGMFNDSSSPTISNCTFSGNAANSGGGMANYGSSSPTVSNCTFSSNMASQYGGGMYNETLSPTISNCTFSDNTAFGGGGMYNFSPFTAVTDSYFCFNTPDAITGIYTDDGGNNLQFCPPPGAIGPVLFGDSDGDGDVDLADFAAFAANWLCGVE